MMDKTYVFLTVLWFAGILAQVYYVLYTIKKGSSKHTAYNTMVWTAGTWFVLVISNIYVSNYVWAFIALVAAIICFWFDYRNYKRY